MESFCETIIQNLTQSTGVHRQHPDTLTLKYSLYIPV